LSKFSITALAGLFFSSLATAQYTRTDLVVGPSTADPSLVNGWGLTALPTSFFWVSDNGTGASTLYTGTGLQLFLSP